MANPVIENQTTHVIKTNDFSYSHTGTGSSLLAVVLISQRYGAQTGIVGVTYGGNAMTRAVPATGNGMGYVYYLSSAPSGSQTVAVDVLAGAVGRDWISRTLTITGADSSPVNVTNFYSSTTDNSIDLSITTTVADCLLVSALGATTGSDPTVSGSGHTELDTNIYSGGIYGFGYLNATTAASYTLGFTTTGQSNDFGLSVLAIKPAAAASTFRPKVIMY